MRIIGNLDKPTSGTIEYRDGADQQMGFVFQDSVLLPWKNVRQNAEFPLVIQKKQTKENEEKLDELLELAGLSEFKTALPRELSGGMKQRVSIVRALSYDAPLLLMDEPFGALDALTRDHLNEELLKIWQKTKKTVIFVTHSIEEATFLVGPAFSSCLRDREESRRWWRSICRVQGERQREMIRSSRNTISI